MIRVETDREEPTLRWVVLDRPEKVNALDDAMVLSLVAALDEAEADGVRTLALDSTQRHFCAGLDLELADVEPRWRDSFLSHRLTRIATLLERFRTSRIATAVVVDGGAFGAGADLSLACQHRVAVTGATWTFPGVRFGVALGTAQLARLVGADRARRILLSQAVVDHDQAIAWGLVHTVAADHGAAQAEVRAQARRLARLSPAIVTTVLELTEQPGRDAAVGALARSATEGSVAERLIAFREGDRCG